MAVKVGDKVTTTAVTNVAGVHLASWVRTRTFDVIAVRADGSVRIGFNGQITATVAPETITVIGGEPEPVKTPEVPPAPEPVPEPPPPPSSDDIAKAALDSLQPAGVDFNLTPGNIGDGSVQKPNEFGKASMLGDDGKLLPYSESINDLYPLSSPSGRVSIVASDLEKSLPTAVQNQSKFPPVKSIDRFGRYKYSYYMDHEANGLGVDTLKSMDVSINRDIRTRADLYKKYISSYNRYKVANANDFLTRTTSHVFFIRPDCNLYESNVLKKDLRILPEFFYADKHCPDVIKELTQHVVHAGEYTHEFMLFLSNKVRSFQIQGEYIDSDQYGQGLTGYKIPYGKHNIQSRANGTFQVRYNDDRDLRIYNLHKLWIEYISRVYRGELYPLETYIKNKILDYATCVYYFLTAENGEDIIFWSKYWGVFPIDAPSDNFSFNATDVNGVDNPELDIKYAYAWKEDFNPLTIVEFNTHCSETQGFRYIPIYQPSKLGTGYTWSGPPFIETLNGNYDIPYTFKLRFRPDNR